MPRIRWGSRRWLAATGAFSLIAAGGAALVPSTAFAVVATTPSCGAPTISGTTATVTCTFTGTLQTFTYPPGVSSASFTVDGAQGANDGTGDNAVGYGGLGGESVATLSEAPGTTLDVTVGGDPGGSGGGYGGGGSGGYYPGGGGGSFVADTSGTDLVVAGGGGGGGSCESFDPNPNTSDGGAGGGVSGADGLNPCYGRASTGGSGPGGGIGQGGSTGNGGGGGGGYVGGEATGDTSGGGGGSGYVPAGGSTTTGGAVNGGNGQVVITYDLLQTSTMLASSLNPSVSGQATRLTATVTDPTDPSVPPAGSVDFTANGTTLCAAVPVDPTTGMASCDLTGAASQSPYAATATYVPAAPDDLATSTGSLSQVVDQAATTTSVSGPSSATRGEMVTFTASVAPVAPGGGTPTGAVTFTAGGAPICGSDTIGLDANGQASCTTSFDRVGSDPVVAMYAGDANFSGSDSSASPFAFAVDPTPLTITASDATAPFGGPAPSVTPQYSGLIDGDTPASLMTAPTCAVTGGYSTTEQPGTYPGQTACSGAVDANYTITYVDGSVTVTGAAPAFTGGNSATAMTGHSADIVITATGSPAPTVSTDSPLPPGLTVSSSPGSGSLALSGTPSKVGSYPLSVTASNGVTPDATETFTVDVVNGYGYRVALSDGHTYALGAATHHPAQAIGPGTTIGVADDTATGGYWEVNTQGVVTAVAAPAYGSLTSKPLSPVVGIAATPDGGGYWVLTANGTVHPFGTAQDHPAVAGSGPLGAKAVGIAPTADGGGYWIAAADGAVVAHGDAVTGLPAAPQGTAPVVGIAADDATGGYWLAHPDGTVTDINAPAKQDTAGSPGSPVVAIIAPPTGIGYWLVASRGGVFPHGAVPFLGDAPTTPATTAASST